MNRNDAIDFARAHALHHGRAGDHAYLPSTLEQAAEFLPHAWVVDALCEAVETRIVDDEAVLKLALDRGYTPTDDFGDEELLSFARELRTALTPWSLSEEPTGEFATCNKCGYRVCHEDCGAEDYEAPRRTAAYWKAEHLAGNAKIEQMHAEYEDMKRLLLGNARNLNIEGERAREHLRLAIDHIAALNGALEDLASLGATIAICGTKYDDAAARKVLGPSV